MSLSSLSTSRGRPPTDQLSNLIHECQVLTHENALQISRSQNLQVAKYVLLWNQENGVNDQDLQRNNVRMGELSVRNALAAKSQTYCKRAREVRGV